MFGKVTILSLLFLVCLTQAAIEPQCLAYRSLSTPSKQPNLVNCPQYRSLSCCDTTTDKLILPDEKGEQLYGFNWNRCGNLSDACYRFFQAESCYFECDPYQAPWKNKVFNEPVGFIGVPLCSTYCDAWYDACKDDYTCGAEWLLDFVSVKVNGTTVRYDCPADGVCRKFSEVYTSPRGLCDILWGSSFHYSEDEESCVVWDFALTSGNPNAHVTPKEYAVDSCDVVPPQPLDGKEDDEDEDEVENPAKCLIRREFSEPKKVNDLETCKEYRDLSCCGTEVDAKVNPKKFFQCGELSQTCADYFRKYECYYQCDPYLHIFGETDFGNPETPFGVPICAETCDGWFEACKNDLTCASEWTSELIEDQNGNYVCGEGTKCLTFKEVFQNPIGMCDLLFGSYFHYSYDEDNCVSWDFKKGKNPHEEVAKIAYGQGDCPEPEYFTTFEKTAIALGVVLSLVTVSLIIFIIILIVKEKNQKPLFQKL